MRGALGEECCPRLFKLPEQSEGAVGMGQFMVISGSPFIRTFTLWNRESQPRHRADKDGKVFLAVDDHVYKGPVQIDDFWLDGLHYC